METKATQPSAAELYDLDFFEWTVRNSELLRSGRFDEADLGHIAEEIEDMGKRDRRELRNRLEVLLRHLLKWQLQPERRGRSWRLTTNTQRRRIQGLLSEMPSLRPHIEEIVPAIYMDAVGATIDETGISGDCFPAACNFSLDQILDTESFPN